MAKRKRRDLLEAEFRVTVRVDPQNPDQTVLMGLVEDNIVHALKTESEDEGFADQFEAVSVKASPWRVVKVPIEEEEPPAGG